MYEELLRVPLLLRLPDRRGAGTRSNVPAMHVDIAPTLLAAAGIRLDADRFAPEGRDLLALLQVPDEAARRVVRSEATLYGAEVKQIREGSRKIITRSADGAEERYDLESDPGEARELGGDAALRFGALERVLDVWLASIPPEPTAPGRDTDVVKGDAQLGEQLEALGYIE
jgi:arylsulfatase A-like enzyme